jgi:hypothetical protein
MLIDMRKDAPDQAKTIDPDALSTEVEKLQGIQKQIKDLEDRVKDLKEDEKYFSCNIIPKLMEDMNLASLKLKDGSELTVKKIFSATLKADKKAEGIHWLRDNGLGDIVKNNITVTFGQGEDNKAVEYAGLARERGYEPTQDEKVHHASLTVVMKDYKEKGNEIPSDLFSTFDGSQTKLKNK